MSPGTPVKRSSKFMPAASEVRIRSCADTARLYTRDAWRSSMLPVRGSAFSAFIALRRVLFQNDQNSAAPVSELIGEGKTELPTCQALLPFNDTHIDTAADVLAAASKSPMRPAQPVSVV